MREYEATIIIQPQLESDDRDELVGRIEELLVPGSAEEEGSRLDIWGLRRLAYPIQNQTEGYYVFYAGEMDPTRIQQIERSLQYMEDVLRYMIVRKEG